MLNVKMIINLFFFKPKPLPNKIKDKVGLELDKIVQKRILT